MEKKLFCSWASYIASGNKPTTRTINLFIST